MYLKIPEYSLIYFYIKKIEKLNNNLKLEYKSLEKIEKDKINFKIFDLYSIDTHLLEKEKYFGTLEFNHYPKTNEVYVYKVPTIYLNNVKIPIFTSNIAKIIVKKLNKELLPKDIKLMFSSPFSILAIDRFVKQVIPSIEETKNMQLLNQIVNQIDKEINLQMYKDNMDVIVKELSNLIDMKLDGFIKSQRKLNANNVRISAMNTYILGEVMRQILGDEFYENYKNILESARGKANYYVNRDTEGISKEDLYNFYNIGKIYRNE